MPLLSLALGGRLTHWGLQTSGSSRTNQEIDADCHLGSQQHLHTASSCDYLAWWLGSKGKHPERRERSYKMLLCLLMTLAWDDHLRHILRCESLRPAHIPQEGVWNLTPSSEYLEPLSFLLRQGLRPHYVTRMSFNSHSPVSASQMLRPVQYTPAWLLSLFL